ncbi:unnamed protein product [Lactuca virosa]|uniref:CASP-like protein n=1 Tax=Lactuca virosa TaxID=75947 RepID=A0AAU9M640_9ASTR|nr:unnamed protein product [Lactuca virosa]
MADKASCETKLDFISEGALSVFLGLAFFRCSTSTHPHIHCSQPPRFPFATLLSTTHAHGHPNRYKHHRLSPSSHRPCYRFPRSQIGVVVVDRNYPIYLSTVFQILLG